MQIDKSKIQSYNWGIYKIENLINNDIYIGSTTENFIKRYSKHKSDLKRFIEGGKFKLTCPLLYKAIIKYGTNNFIFIPLKIFKNKKNSNKNKQIVTYLEEKLIKKLNPKYNICLYPSLSGIPNLGIKLTDEWKNNISKKSKLYKHKSNIEIYNKKSNQNKELSSLYKIENNNSIFTGSMTDCCKFANINISTAYKWLNKVNKTSRNGWSIKKIKSQKKKIKLLNNNLEIILNSFSECDKFLNMWKGFTSTQVVNNKLKILDYDYEILQ